MRGRPVFAARKQRGFVAQREFPLLAQPVPLCWSCTRAVGSAAERRSAAVNDLSGRIPVGYWKEENNLLRALDTAAAVLGIKQVA